MEGEREWQGTACNTKGKTVNRCKRQHPPVFVQTHAVCQLPVVHPMSTLHPLHSITMTTDNHHRVSPLTATCHSLHCRFSLFSLLAFPPSSSFLTSCYSLLLPTCGASPKQLPPQ
jgi:hypothetical protein